MDNEAIMREADKPKARRGRPPKASAESEKSSRVEVVVMHKTNVQLDSAKPEGIKAPFRWRGVIDRKEYDAICALDDAAGREHRLMAL